MRARLLLGAVAAAVLVVALLAVDGRGEGFPLDPEGTGPQGLAALVDVLGELGAQVTVAETPPAAADTALLVADRLDDDARADLEAWVAQGGRLIIADPESPLAPERDATVGLGTPRLTRDCDVAALAGAEAVAPGTGAATYAAPGCFPAADGGGVWLTLDQRGAGTVVALGDPQPLTNAHLADADHAELAAALLAPTDEAAVAVLAPPAPGEDEVDLISLVDPRVWWALAQLGLVAVLILAWRGPRDAELVAERPAVALPASELVLATADLREQHGGRGESAASLRRAAREHATARLGLAPDLDAPTLAEQCHRRAGIAGDRAYRALTAEPADDAGLVVLGTDVAALRAALDAPGPSAAAPAQEDLR